MADAAARLNAALSDRYRIERELGQGGMATVYLAHDLKHERKVAIKVLHPDLAAALGPQRFLTEVKTTANLQHPHILPLHDSGEADGLLFYVMPYVEGESLHDRLNRERPLPIEDAVGIAREVADALDYTHRQRTVIAQSSGYLSDVRVSPSSDAVAFFEHPTKYDGWLLRRRSVSPRRGADGSAAGDRSGGGAPQQESRIRARVCDVRPLVSAALDHPGFDRTTPARTSAHGPPPLRHPSRHFGRRAPRLRREHVEAPRLRHAMVGRVRGCFDQLLDGLAGDRPRRELVDGPAGADGFVGVHPARRHGVGDGGNLQRGSPPSAGVPDRSPVPSMAPPLPAPHVDRPAIQHVSSADELRGIDSRAEMGPRYRRWKE